MAVQNDQKFSVLSKESYILIALMRICYSLRFYFYLYCLYSSEKQKRVCAVVGGTGFIGSHVVNELVQRGKYQVHVLGRTFRKETVNPAVDAFIQVDIMDFNGLVRALQGVDSVINCAAAIPGVFSTAEEVWHVNKQGLENVLRAAQKCGIKNFILVTNLHPKHASSHPVTRAWLNGKIAGEELVTESNSKEGMRTCAIQPGLVLGRKGPFTEAILSKKITTFPMMDYRIQVVPVEYLARGIVAAEEKLAVGSESISGKVLPIAGEEMTHRKLLTLPAWKRNISALPLWAFYALAKINSAIGLVTGWTPLGDELCPAIANRVFDNPPKVVDWTFVQDDLEIGPPPSVERYIEDMVKGYEINQNGAEKVH